MESIAEREREHERELELVMSALVSNHLSGVSFCFSARAMRLLTSVSESSLRQCGGRQAFRLPVILPNQFAGP